MTRQRAFETAAARRRANPIEYVIDGVSVRLKASVDLAEIAPLLKALIEGVDENSTDFELILERRTMALDLVRTFVEDTSVESFDLVASDLAMGEVMELIKEMLAEYSGQANPTPPSSSSDG